jgi:hypothetical protein
MNVHNIGSRELFWTLSSYTLVHVGSREVHAQL